MRALAWYAAIFDILLIVLFILSAAKVIAKPPFTAIEDIAWAVLTIPVVALAVMVLRKRS